MKKKNTYKHVHNYGYQIIIAGHTMFPEDVCKKLDRLDYVEKELLKIYEKEKTRCVHCGKEIKGRVKLDSEGYEFHSKCFKGAFADELKSIRSKND